MTTQLVPFGAAKAAAKFQQALGAHPQESLADGIGASYGVLHYKGKVWSLRYRGKSHVITRPDDGSPASTVDLVILNQARSKSKSYYPKWDPNQSEGERPICASLAGVVPDADVAEKQSDTCALCPRNKWYKGPDGRNKRDCTDYKRLAVFLDPAITARILGAPLNEPIFLRVPPASLDPLGTFGERMQAQSYPYCSFITRVGFEPTSEYPKFTYSEIRLLTDAEADAVLALREDPQTLRIIGDPTVAIPGAARPMLGGPVGGSMAAASPATVQVDTPKPVPQEQPLATPTPSATPAPVSWATVTTVSPSDIPADTGDVVESDAELDDRIKSILGS